VLNTPGDTMARSEVMEKIRGLSQVAADDPSEERIRARLESLMADPVTVTDELVAIRQHIYARPVFAESMRYILCLRDPVGCQSRPAALTWPSVHGLEWNPAIGGTGRPT
jgi:2-hydroxy-6-oxonona-2,4-dienedioate hydrolase